MMSYMSANISSALYPNQIDIIAISARAYSRGNPAYIAAVIIATGIATQVIAKISIVSAILIICILVYLWSLFSSLARFSAKSSAGFAAGVSHPKHEPAIALSSISSDIGGLLLCSVEWNCGKKPITPVSTAIHVAFGKSVSFRCCTQALSNDTKNL